MIFFKDFGTGVIDGGIKRSDMILNSIFDKGVMNLRWLMLLVETPGLTVDIAFKSVKFDWLWSKKVLCFVYIFLV